MLAQVQIRSRKYILDIITLFVTFFWV